MTNEEVLLLRILIIEDNDDLSNFLFDRIQDKFGLQAKRATSKNLDVLISQSWDILICDFNLSEWEVDINGLNGMVYCEMFFESNPNGMVYLYTSNERNFIKNQDGITKLQKKGRFNNMLKDKDFVPSIINLISTFNYDASGFVEQAEELVIRIENYKVSENISKNALSRLANLRIIHRNTGEEVNHKWLIGDRFLEFSKMKIKRYNFKVSKYFNHNYVRVKDVLEVNSSSLEIKYNQSIYNIEHNSTSEEIINFYIAYSKTFYYLTNFYDNSLSNNFELLAILKKAIHHSIFNDLLVRLITGHFLSIQEYNKAAELNELPIINDIYFGTVSQILKSEIELQLASFTSQEYPFYINIDTVSAKKNLLLTNETEFYLLSISDGTYDNKTMYILNHGI